MRDSMKMTVKYQFAYMLLIQLAASAILFLFGIVAFWQFLNMKIVKEIVSIVFIAVNFAMLYISAKNFSIRDNKPYTPLKPSKIKGALFGVGISCVTLILMMLFVFVWNKYGDETGVHGVLPTIVNMAFYLWSFPYNGIMGLVNGNFTAYSAVLMLIIPIAATFSGYIAGCNKFELVEKIDAFMYEKE